MTNPPPLMTSYFETTGDSIKATQRHFPEVVHPEQQHLDNPNLATMTKRILGQFSLAVSDNLSPMKTQ